MKRIAPLESTLMIAAAALLATGLQLACNGALAAPHEAPASVAVVRLPTVTVVAPRATSAAAVVQQLPQVVVVGTRSGSAPQTAQVRADNARISG